VVLQETDLLLIEEPQGAEIADFVACPHIFQYRQ